MKEEEIDIESSVVNANTVKDIVLEKLHRDGVITEEQRDNYSEEFQVIVVKKSWFKGWLKKFSPCNKEGYMYQFVKFEK